MSKPILIRNRACALLLGFATPWVIAQAPAATANPHPVVHVEVLGVDAAKLQRFYADLFGWPVTLNPAGYGYVPVEPTAPVRLTGGIGASPSASCSWCST